MFTRRQAIAALTGEAMASYLLADARQPAPARTQNHGDKMTERTYHLLGAPFRTGSLYPGNENVWDLMSERTGPYLRSPGQIPVLPGCDCSVAALPDDCGDTGAGVRADAVRGEAHVVTVPYASSVTGSCCFRSRAWTDTHGGWPQSPLCFRFWRSCSRSLSPCRSTTGSPAGGPMLFLPTGSRRSIVGTSIAGCGRAVWK